MFVGGAMDRINSPDSVAKYRLSPLFNCHRVTAVELHPPLAPATMAVQVGGIEERGGELLAPSPDY